MIIACTLVYDPSFDSLLTSDMDRQIDRQTDRQTDSLEHTAIRALQFAGMGVRFNDRRDYISPPRAVN